MSFRVTAGDVTSLLIELEDDNDDLTPFIQLGNRLVNDNCLSSGYDSDLLTLLEKLLSAHFYRVTRRARTQDAVSALQDSYEGKVALRLEVTEYGQQAMLFDSAGNLARLNRRMDVTRNSTGASPIGMSWIGKTPRRTVIP